MKGMITCTNCKNELQVHNFCSAKCKMRYYRSHKVPDTDRALEKGFIKVYKIGCPKHGKKKCLICNNKKK